MSFIEWLRIKQVLVIVKKLYMELANEELKHVGYLEALFEKIKNSNEDDRKLAFEDMPPSPEIYNWEKVDKEYISLAMSVFSIGMQMEKASIDFYEEAKTKTEYWKQQRSYMIY